MKKSLVLCACLFVKLRCREEDAALLVLVFSGCPGARHVLATYMKLLSVSGGGAAL